MQPELLWRINVGVETLNRTGEQTSRQMADLVARVEASLQFVVKAWQEATGQGKARLMTKDELAQIRGALVAALEATGGSMVEEDESCLPRPPIWRPNCARRSG
jgi:hypothetical protein